MTRIRRDRSSPHYNQFQRYTTKEHRNSILKLRCKSKRRGPRSGKDERSEPFGDHPRRRRRHLITCDLGLLPMECLKSDINTPVVRFV